MLLKLKIFIRENRELFFQFVRFSLVGLSGTLIDVGLLNLLHEGLGVFVYTAATIAFTAAVINNFLLNKYWTFRHRAGYKSRGSVQFFQFIFVSLVGLLINLGIMYLLIEFLDLWFNWAKAAAIIVVLFWNFVANKLWTFRTKEPL